MAIGVLTNTGIFALVVGMYICKEFEKCLQTSFNYI